MSIWFANIFSDFIGYIFILFPSLWKTSLNLELEILDFKLGWDLTDLIVLPTPSRSPELTFYKSDNLTGQTMST